MAVIKKMTMTPKPKPSPKPKKLTGDAAIKEYQRQISPKGMASASAMNKKAIEKKYPGMFTPAPTTKAKKAPGNVKATPATRPIRRTRTKGTPA